MTKTKELSLRITEIFYSLQGETSFVGLPTAFIRLTGCPLRCQYCDSAYAFEGGKKLSLSEILSQVAKFKAKYVLVTGGEPLAQGAVHPLLDALCAANYSVSLETGGALDISKVNPKVHIILDLKTPGSKESNKNKLSNLKWLKPQDQIKFVLCHYADYCWAKDLIKAEKLADICAILMSPSFHELPNVDLADWIVADNLPVRFQMQMHKYIWGDVPGK